MHVLLLQQLASNVGRTIPGLLPRLDRSSAPRDRLELTGRRESRKPVAMHTQWGVVSGQWSV
ncbi:MAG: hypothetical protein WA208_03270, partial [Thermoanaerobaculia bacterium]